MCTRIVDVDSLESLSPLGRALDHVISSLVPDNYVHRHIVEASCRVLQAASPISFPVPESIPLWKRLFPEKVSAVQIEETEVIIQSIVTFQSTRKMATCKLQHQLAIYVQISKKGGIAR